MFAVLIYISAITCANLLIAAFGPWFSAINSFALIGLDLALRDYLHDRWQGRWLWPKMMALIGSAGAISYLINTAAGRIAIASVIAFCAAGLVDAIVYHALRGRPYLQKSNASNAAGAAADSALFPMVAFAEWLPAIAVLQFASKVVGGVIWSILLPRFNVAKAEAP